MSEVTGEAAAQPGEGQGAVSEPQGGSGLYDLSHIDAELRPLVEGELRKFDGNVTKEFQKRAESLKAWEPYEQLGLRDVPVEHLQELLEFGKLAQDPNQFQEWFSQAAQEIGYQPELDFDSWSKLGQENGWYEDDGSVMEPEFDPQELKQEMMQEWQQMMEPFLNQFREQQQEQRVSEQTQHINTELKELHEQHGEFDDDAVKRLALSYADDPDALKRAVDDYLRITGKSQSDLVEQKVKDPLGMTLNGGSPNTSPEEFQGLDDPKLKAAVKARFGN